MNGELPTSADLQAAWEDLQDIYVSHLERHEVKIPQTDYYDGLAKSIWLSVLHYHEGKEVHKDLISDVCQRDLPGSARDQQVRHLKRDGWRLASAKRGYHKLDPYQPSLEWINDKARRDGILNARSFEDIKVVFGHTCATCGAREGRPDRRYGEDKVVLQQGHRDPHQPATDKNNIIPQCQFCNRAYRGDFVFDENGRVRAVAGIGPIQRATLEIKRKVFAWLSEHLHRR